MKQVLIAAIVLAASTLVVAAPAKAPVAHVQCAVCKVAVKEARHFARGKTIEEEDALADLVELLCNGGKDEGEWTKHIDILQVSGEEQLTIEKKDELGQCRQEC